MCEVGFERGRLGLGNGRQLHAGLYQRRRVREVLGAHALRGDAASNAAEQRRATRASTQKQRIVARDALESQRVHLQTNP